MKKINTCIYLLLTAVLLMACIKDPTAGVKVPEYNPAPEQPSNPGDEMDEDDLIGPSEPLERGLVHLKGRRLTS
ncbi:hypothetical protein [Bacteroides rodentium]